MTSLTPRLDLLERNTIINGAFDIWQRGTSFSVNNTGKYTSDRWEMTTSSAFTTTVTRSTDVPTQVQSGFQGLYSILTTNGTGAATGASDIALYEYSLEGSDYQSLHNKKCRFQFWVKSSVTGTYSVVFTNNNQNRSYTTTYSVPVANTWQKVVIDLQMDSSGTWLFDSNLGLTIVFGLNVGSTFQQSSLNTWLGVKSFGATTQTQWGATTGATFQLAQVMLMPQDLATATASTSDVIFQRCGRSIAHELQLCQRYCEVFNATTHQYYAPGVMNTTTTSQAQLYYSQKRAAPTVTLTANTTFLAVVNGGASPSAVSVGSQQTMNSRIVVTIPATTAGFACFLIDNSGSSIIVDAEF